MTTVYVETIANFELGATRPSQSVWTEFDLYDRNYFLNQLQVEKILATYGTQLELWGCYHRNPILRLHSQGDDNGLIYAGRLLEGDYLCVNNLRWFISNSDYEAVVGHLFRNMTADRGDRAYLRTNMELSVTFEGKHYDVVG